MGAKLKGHLTPQLLKLDGNERVVSNPNIFICPSIPISLDVLGVISLCKGSLAKPE